MAENLDEEDQQKLARERGEVLLEQWENTYRSDYDIMRAAIRASLWSSFWIIVSAALLAVAAGLALGRISLSLPIDASKVLAFAGSALVAWATLMELGGDFPVWDGKAFPQLAHTVVFKAIFVPGVAMVLASVLL